MSVVGTVPRSSCHCVNLTACVQLCPLRNPMNGSLPHSIHGIFQARVLEWVACFPLGVLLDPGIELMPQCVCVCVCACACALQVDCLSLASSGYLGRSYNCAVSTFH